MKLNNQNAARGIFDAGRHARNVTVRGNQGMPSTIEVWVLPKNQFFHHNLLALSVSSTSRPLPAPHFSKRAEYKFLPNFDRAAPPAKSLIPRTIKTGIRSTYPTCRYRGAFHFV